MESPQRLFGKKALITGAGGGIGKAIAIMFARHGASVCLWDVAQEQLNETLKAVNKAGGAGIAAVVDIANAAGIGAALQSAAHDLHGLDILVNAAGVNAPSPALDVTEASWNRIMDINLKGSFFTAQAFARAYLAAKEAGAARRGGRIINISSSLAHSVLPDRTPYLASKGGVNLITKALALEWAPLGITVNAVGPAIVDTEMTRSMGSNAGVHPKMLLGRLIHPEEIAAAALYLASEDAAMVTGQTLYVDAGWTIH